MTSAQLGENQSQPTTRTLIVTWAIAIVLLVATGSLVWLSVSQGHQDRPDASITGTVIAADGITKDCALVDGMGAVQGDGNCAAVVVRVTTTSIPGQIAVGSTQVVYKDRPWAVGDSYSGTIDGTHHGEMWSRTAALVGVISAAFLVGGLTMQIGRRNRRVAEHGIPSWHPEI